MDPYKVLGVNRSDDDETIKKAYRALVKKYHPDQYQDSPLHDLAEEKMKEINIAYDQIQKERAGAGVGGEYYSSSGSSSYQHIRNLINQNRFQEALSALASMTDRSAEWYYLNGVAMVRVGRVQAGTEHLKTACQMDPSNTEYRSTLEYVTQQSQSYTYRQPSNADCDTCSLCQTMICLDCCCECIGGDLISCC